MTLEEVNKWIEKSEMQMKHAIEHLDHELVKLRTGKASPSLVSDIMVEYYGSPTPMNNVASISTSDARTLVIQPWEKPMLKVIENAIFEANIGITPQNDGEVIRLNLPPLTEERRKDLVKQAKHLAEEAKVSIRNARRDGMEHIKRLVKEGLPEDLGKRKEDEVQKLTDVYSEKAGKHADSKEHDIMTL